MPSSNFDNAAMEEAAKGKTEECFYAQSRETVWSLDLASQRTDVGEEAPALATPVAALIGG